MSDGHKRKEWKFFISYYKEIKWLEQMAEEGWFLENVSLGIRYTFVKGEPKRMVYDVDRFYLPAKPTLEEIREKEVFMEMAQEMGWREVTHDEQLTYYFTKEYAEGEINELHNDEESRRYHVGKFRNVISDQVVQLLRMIVFVSAIDIILRWMQVVEEEYFLGWFDWFAIVYNIFVGAYILILWRIGARIAREFSLTRAEWEKATDPHTHKKIYRLILTNRGLNRFLEKQQQAGWILKDMTSLSYSFEKGAVGQYMYTMDSKWLLEKRRTEKGQFSDKKDWMGWNGDWAIASVNEAEQKGWRFVCALGSRSIIYCGERNQIQPLNEKKYDKRLRFISLAGQFGVVMLVGGLIGGICGFLVGYFGF